MAFSLNGIGTAHYGRRELPDGSYITTKWFVLLFVPVVPICSYRVVGDGSNARTYGVGPSVYTSKSLRTQEIPLDSRQVLRTYAGAALVIGIIAFIIWHG